MTPFVSFSYIFSQIHRSGPLYLYFHPLFGPIICKLWRISWQWGPSKGIPSDWPINFFFWATFLVCQLISIISSVFSRAWGGGKRVPIMQRKVRRGPHGTNFIWQTTMRPQNRPRPTAQVPISYRRKALGRTCLVPRHALLSPKALGRTDRAGLRWAAELPGQHLVVLRCSSNYYYVVVVVTTTTKR